MLNKIVVSLLLFSICESRFTQHGLPYYPIGGFVYNFDENWNTQLIDMEGTFGMNFVCPYWDNNPLDQNIRYMDRCAEIDVGIHYSMYELSNQPPSVEKRKNITELVKKVYNHPALFGYYISDEPDCGRSSPPFCIPPENLIDTYKTIKSVDKTHPVTVLVNNPNAMRYYINASDITMSDPYPCQSPPNSVGPVTSVSGQADVLNELNKSFMITPMAWGGDNEGCERTPTSQEERVMTYLATIHGAKGIQYFSRGLRYPVSERAWAECRQVALEMQELSPALVDGKRLDILIIPNIIDCAAWNYTSSHVSYVIIMCANTENFPSKILVELNNLSNNESDVMFENRKISIEFGNTIYDMISGYGTKVYRIVEYEKEKYQVDENNMIANPSFEDQYNIGIPDGVAVSWLNPYGSSLKVDSRISVHGIHSLRNIIADDYAMVTFALCEKQGGKCGVILSQEYIYEFSLWAKSNSKNQTIYLYFVGIGGYPPIVSDVYNLTHEWTRYSFSSLGNLYNVGYNISHGIAWIDLVEIVKVE